MKKQYAVIVLFLSSIGWGLTWLPIKALKDSGMDGMHLVLLAFASGAIVLTPALLKQYQEWKKHYGYMLLIALAGGFANAAFQISIYYGDVVRVMILFYMLPIWSVIGGRIFLKEKIDQLRIIAVVLCLGGASIILGVWDASWEDVGWIDLLAAGSGLGLSATIILFRLTQTIPVASKVTSIFYGCSILIAVSIMIFPVGEWAYDNSELFIAVIYGAVWLTLITLGTQWAVTHIDAGRSAIIIIMELVVAVVSSTVLTNAQINTYEILGIFLVMIAATSEAFRNDKQSTSGSFT